MFWKVDIACRDDTHDIVEVTEDVDAKESRADGEDVEVKLVVREDTHMPRV